MQFSLSIATAILAATASALPILEIRQTVGTTANEFTSGGCKDVVLLYARGTSQSGNMGEEPGPALGNALKTRLGAARVAVQGVSYSASLLGNLNPGGAPASEATSFRTLIGQVASQCPNARIVVSGYSQGGALVHRAVEGTTAAVSARIAAGVTFGDTQKQQDGGRIPGIDASKSLIICNTGDRVCEGTLIITSAHSGYGARVGEAVDFIAARV
ncbi:uncharacterized protein PgNI_02535 [Pyricularia grisea]|uniref:Cutinase n=1 Tax=Pyricularia grisea TaxID=148305 RepID=A0A6P8BFF9_PYRGI|nr:uncharacterized protein PgNI_02535 [Pyricularia grisea]TLD15533.1 hypothetical protein PgNI_02535 [Pyricularia grisea]